MMLPSFLLVCFQLIVAATASHEVLPGEVYWNKMLPNTPMPGAITDFLHPAATASHEVLPGEVYWNKMLPNTPMPGAIRDFLHPAKTTEQLAKVSYTAVKEKDMLPGTKVTMRFVRTTAGFGPTFLSRQAATSTPFSSTNLQTIFSQLSITPNSEKAEAMQKTLQECERPAAEGETKFCATSLESMVEYTTKRLGTRDVSAVSTVISKEGAPSQQYTIAPSGVKKLSGSDFVACHAKKFPYVVYYCHRTQGISAYEAKLLGEDGTTAEAVAVCHSKIAYGTYLKGVKIKNDHVPVCHFLPQDHIVWGLNK